MRNQLSWSNPLDRISSVGNHRIDGLDIVQQKEALLIWAQEKFLQSKARREASRFEKFKSLWKKNSAARMVAWVAMAGWAMFALASGAAAVAGGILATRAVFSGIGGFIAADGAIDFGQKLISKNKMDNLLRAIDTVESLEEIYPYVESASGDLESAHLDTIIAQATERRERFQKSKLLASATVGAVMAILGSSSAAHALEQGGSIVSKGVAEVASGHASSVKLPDMKTILEDIRHDHPGQKYVTLEQAVRRIEGIKAGIPLDHSEQLQSMNASISQMVHNPDGIIVKNMEELGYMTKSGDMEAAARTLTSEKIQAVLEKTYNIPETIPVASPDHALSSALPASPVPTASFSQDIWVAPSAQSDAIVGMDSSWKIGSSALIGMGILWYGITRYFRRSRNVQDMPEISQELLRSSRDSWARVPRTPEIINMEHDGENTYYVPEPQAVIPNTPPQIPANHMPPPTVIPEARIPESAMNINEEARLLVESSIAEVTDLHFVQNTPRGRKYEAQTIPGKFVLYLDIATAGSLSFVFEWEDDGNTLFSERFTKAFPQNAPLADSKEIAKTAFREAYFAAFLQREIRKQLEAREIDTFEIATRDLGRIVEQCETPASLRGNETGGYFFQSLYGIKNKTLRFYNLNNPREDEIDASPVDFAIKASNSEGYFRRGFLSSDAYFQPKESGLLDEWIGQTTREHRSQWGGDGVTQGASGIVDLYNWHKHPGGPEGPSPMDVENGEWIRLDQSKFRQIVTWGIVNRISRIPDRIPDNMLIIEGSLFGKPYHYKITFWKLLKLSPDEEDRRRAIIQEVGIPRASASGICDRRGNPKRVNRDIRIGRHTISSDLKSMKIKTV